jgi:hypothetical protein
MSLRVAVSVFILLAVALAAGVAPIAFEEIAAKSGLRFTTDSSPTPNKNQPETMVAGVGLIDYDNDGYLDVYLVNGAAIPSLRKESPRYWNRLFHNNRDGTFTDVTEKAGVRGEGYGMGVAIGDYDNDGWSDIFVANVTGNQLFHNNHDGTFTDVTEKAGLAGAVLDGKKMWSVSAGWFDYDNDGRLDLFVSNYVKWDVDKDPYCGPNPQTRAYCHPKNYAPLPNTLYRNNGDGTFTDVSDATGISKSLGKGMGVVFADYDHDGFTDVFVANDNAPNLLFHNLGGKRFEEAAMQSGVAYPESGAFISGMGADFRDVDNDGRPDIWHTAIEGESFPLFRNSGDGQFTETTMAAGLAHATRDMSGWSNGIFDFDNDGWKDLFVARGNVQDNLALMSLRKSEEPNSVFRNLGNGKFQAADAGADVAKPASHRGAAFGDLDNDGRIDAVVTVLNGPVKYFHNISPGGNHWILLRLVGTKSNRMGLGAQVAITVEDGTRQWNHATTSTGYAASSDPRVHFGLGASKIVKDIEILWPSGIRQSLRNVPADRIVTVTEK